MFMNAVHMRLALVGGGVVLLGFFFLMGGSLGQPEVIQLDFSIYPEQLEGSEVEIDGKVVGKLKATGPATRTGFEVEPGSHVVRVLHPELASAEIKVEVAKAQKLRLMLDLVESYDAKTHRPVMRIDAR